VSEGRRFLIDTSAWIETLRPNGEPTIRDQVRDLTADDRAVLCDPVRLELWNGAGGSREHRLLRELEENLKTVPTTLEVWGLARDLARSARNKGLTVPIADILIAACAEHHGLGIVHRDAHFDRLAELRRPNL
jgi:predicted nucleic acid-binding protein